MRRLDVTLRPNAGDVWLPLKEPAQDAPLLVHGKVGQGAVLLLTTAIAPQWTNLPTKPLFVPLLHESLRGVLGNAGDASSTADLVAGQQPVLGAAWDGVQQLVHHPIAGDDTEASATGDAKQTVLLRRTNAGFEPVAALQTPGLYTAAPEARGRVLAVNVDAVDGDTRTIDEAALTDWLNRALPEPESWRWLDEDEPIRSLSAYASRANVGWPLLWIVLALVLLELCLARWFSHASASATAGATGSSGAAAFLRQAAGRAATKQP